MQSSSYICIYIKHTSVVSLNIFQQYLCACMVVVLLEILYSQVVLRFCCWYSIWYSISHLETNKMKFNIYKTKTKKKNRYQVKAIHISILYIINMCTSNDIIQHMPIKYFQCFHGSISSHHLC